MKKQTVNFAVVTKNGIVQSTGILVLLNIPSSSFYKEMQKIKATIGKIIG